MAQLTLGLEGLSYPDLSTLDGLQRVDRAFLAHLAAAAPQQHDALLAWRDGRSELTDVDASEMLIACAEVLEEFIGELFGIRRAVTALQLGTLSHDPVLGFRKLYVQRRARRRLMKKDVDESFEELDAWVSSELQKAQLPLPDRELAVARMGLDWLKQADRHEQELELLTRWCIRALSTPEGRSATADWVAFHLPAPVNHEALVPAEPLAGDKNGRMVLSRRRRRDGFDLTDPRMSQREVQAEVDYCVYCHDHDGDFCSRGFPVKKGEPDKGIKTDPLGVELVGCPLDERISEMHRLKRDGHTVGALAMIMVDNPMCPATGHRICNDCMKACIYQKQDPVNIPQTETGVLVDVLNLPWGVEIYDLLTRWNPLRRTQYLPKPYNGLKVLVAGMGPAGFTLAHHLTMEGFGVVGIDGLKIEPLPFELVEQPIHDYSSITEKLDARVLTGFGGVAEYGITVRWDKNFLKLLYLTLLRRPTFQVFGGVRFGGTLTVEDAAELGFDHVAIAVGAGLPRAIPIPGSLAPGMRMAADFLMTLQLTGAGKYDSLANLQVRLPAVVIGGGLTGVDAATEVQAYYVVQVEKLLARYEKLEKLLGEKKLRAGLDEASLAILDEHLEHGRAIRAERKLAAYLGKAPDLQKLIARWGGVTIAYRRRMQESPAYIRNHEEVIRAMEEGIVYAEHLGPKAAKLDRHGHVCALLCERMARDEDGTLKSTGIDVELAARTILVATGAKPNIAYQFEHTDTFELDGSNYRAYVYKDDALAPAPAAQNVKDPAFGAFTSYNRNGMHVSFIGDTNPVFNGNVVMAVASGQRIYPRIVETFGARARNRGDMKEYAGFRSRMQNLLQASVVEVKRHTRDIVEVVVHAPQAARRYGPPQSFRLQSYETVAPLVGDTRLQTETLPLTGSRVDRNAGTISLIVRERGASSRLCATMKRGDPVVLMGPSGNKSSIPENATVLVAGDWLAMAAMRALGPAHKAAGNRVLLMLSLPNEEAVFCRDELEQAADAIVWVTAAGRPVAAGRPQDTSVTGEFADVMLRYADGELAGDGATIRFDQIDLVQIIADHELLRAVREARRGPLQAFFSKNPPTTGSIYNNMQCMLKGVCSQCLQWQIDPRTGERTKAVFACSWTEEPVDMVDLNALNGRLSQNRLQEHIANLWLDHLFDTAKLTRV